jgi:ribosome-binding protein aMBF1 (putative translation factor)
MPSKVSIGPNVGLGRPMSDLEFGSNINNLGGLTPNNSADYAKAAANNMARAYANPRECGFDLKWFVNVIETGMNGVLCKGLFVFPGNDPSLSVGAKRGFRYPPYKVTEVWEQAQIAAGYKREFAKVPWYPKNYDQLTVTGKAVTRGDVRSDGSLIVTMAATVEYTKDKNGVHVMRMTMGAPVNDTKGRHADDPDYGKVKSFTKATGQAIATARNALHINQQQLAHRLGISVKSVELIETGDATYNGAVLSRINAFLGSEIKQ